MKRRKLARRLGFVSVLSRRSTVTTDIGIEPSHVREGKFYVRELYVTYVNEKTDVRES